MIKIHSSDQEKTYSSIRYKAFPFRILILRNLKTWSISINNINYVNGVI